VKALEKFDLRAQELAIVVGWVSLGIGISLSLAPRRSARVVCGRAAPVNVTKPGCRHVSYSRDTPTGRDEEAR